MKIILSTRNPSKTDQIKAMFNDPSFVVQTLDEVGIIGEGIEDGTTLEENAYKKAWYAHEKSDGTYWTMADDTGLFILGLNGEPGIRAARWIGKQATTEEVIAYTLKRMENIIDRTARFETTVVLISPEGKKHSFSGDVTGTILNFQKTKPQPKMPFSSLFMPKGNDKVWAEMSIEEENKLSHRGQAFRQVIQFLKTQL
jgi:XTP/dITP diphosphohydrolase